MSEKPASLRCFFERRQKSQRFPDMPQQPGFAATHDLSEPFGGSQNEAWRLKTRAGFAPPFVHQQESPEVDFPSLVMTHQRFHFAPRQPAVDARRHLLAECRGFDAQRAIVRRECRSVGLGRVFRQGGGNFRTRLGFAGKLLPQPFTESGGCATQPGE